MWSGSWVKVWPEKGGQRGWGLASQVWSSCTGHRPWTQAVATPSEVGHSGHGSQLCSLGVLLCFKHMFTSLSGSHNCFPLSY